MVRVLDVRRGLGRLQLLEIEPGTTAKAGDVIRYSGRLDAVLEPTKFLVARPAGSENLDDILTLSLQRSGRFRPTVMSAKGRKEVWKERRYTFFVQPLVSSDEAGPRLDFRVSSRYTGEALFVVGENFFNRCA